MSDSWRDELVTKGVAADAARDAYKRNTTAAISAMMAIKDLPPSAQPVRKTGQWIKRKKGAIGYNCSCCGKSDISNHFDYCPNCGADMRGNDDEKCMDV